MSENLQKPRDWWDPIFDGIHNLDAARDAEINRLEREVGANEAVIACSTSPGWKLYQVALRKKFQGLLEALVNGVTLTEGERFHLQGRLAELAWIADDAEKLQESNVETKQRLDQLRSERKNLEERAEMPTTIGGAQ